MLPTGYNPNPNLHRSQSQSHRIVVARERVTPKVQIALSLHYLMSNDIVIVVLHKVCWSAGYVAIGHIV